MTAKDFEKEYNRWHLPLGMYVLRMTSDTDASQDIVQNVFAEVWSRISSGDDISNFRSYLYRAAHNAALTWIRQNDRFEHDVDMKSYQVNEDDIDTSERDARLWRAIDSLPDCCREIFLLSKRDGMTNAEIGEELGLSVKTVENQMTKAYSRLRSDPHLGSGKVFFLPFL